MKKSRKPQLVFERNCLNNQSTFKSKIATKIGVRQGRMVLLECIYFVITCLNQNAFFHLIYDLFEVSTEGCSKLLKKSGNKTSAGEINLVSIFETHASLKVGQDQESGGVSVLCWHAAPVVLCKHTAVS